MKMHERSTGKTLYVQVCITNYTYTKLTGSMSSKKNIDDLNIIIKLCFTLFLKVPIIIIDTDRDA